MNTHVMNIMDQSGHMTITWSPTNQAEVDNAENVFDDMTAKGYSAFRVELDNEQGARMKEFDPTASKIMLVPQLRGG